MTERRPLASRDTGWARSVTRRLAATAITPNQISMASMGFAALAGLAFYLGAEAETGWDALALILAALFSQMRLLCNLFDGLVAVEAGKGTPDGAFWNEAPDRVSDVLILAGLGYGLGIPALGWAAATASVGTAYVRELGRASDGVNDFSGPMAKPQRMALLTGAAVLAALWPLWAGPGAVILIGALWLVVLGSLFTAIKRSVALIIRLKTPD